MSNEITIEMCEQRALGMFLSDWPEDKTYNEIIEALKNDDLLENEEGENTVSVWEPFECHNPDYVADEIEGYFESIIRFIGIEDKAPCQNIE